VNNFAMKFFRHLLATLALTLAISRVYAVYEVNNTPCTIRTITIQEEYGVWGYSGYEPWWYYYWDVTIGYGEVYSIDDVYGWNDEYHYSVIGSSESPDPSCSGGGGGETWESFDEPQGWSYGEWSPDAAGYPEWEWVDQERTNNQWHYYGERSNLGNVRNDGWYLESSTEYRSVPGGTSASWQSFEEVTEDWHEVSCSPDPSDYWEDETFSQSYTEERTVRRGERDQWGNERNVTIDTESWTGARTVDGTRSLGWQSFEEVTEDWHEVSSSPDPGDFWEDQSFTQSYTEERTLRHGERSLRGDERNVSTDTESRTASRSVSGSKPLNWHSFEEVAADWHEIDATPDPSSYHIGTEFTQTYTEERTLRGGETNDRGDETDVSTWTETRSGTRTAEGTINDAPHASLSGSTDLVVGEAGVWSFGAGDANGNLYRWRFHSSTNPNPQWTYVSGSSVSGQYSTAFSSAGVYRWLVDVEDLEGATDTIYLDVIVSLPNHAPSISLSANPDVVVSNGSLDVGVHAYDEDGNLDSMGARWLGHDLRQWWDLSGTLVGDDTKSDRFRSYTETMAVTASTQYMRGEVWDTTDSGVAGDWEAIVVLGSWVPNVAVTPVSTPTTDPVSGQAAQVTTIYSDASDPEVWLGVFESSDSSNSSPLRSATVGQVGSGTITFTLGSDFIVGHSYVVRMFASSGPYAPAATSNAFQIVASNPPHAFSVHYGTVTARTDEDGDSQNDVFYTTGWHTGDIITIAAAPKPGQVFNRWSMEGSGNGTIGNAYPATTIFTVGTTDAGVQALYTGSEPLYLVTVNGGHAIPAGPQPAEKVLTVTADPPPGKRFSSWSFSGHGFLDDSTQNPTSFIVGEGADTITALFADNLLPVITTQPLNRNALPGSTGSFSVVASGSGLSYLWRKDGVALSNNSHFTGVDTPTLTVSNIKAADAGVYTVVVSNTIGSVTSTTVVLAIISNDPGNQNQLNIHLPTP
jgi:hypothetical protein